MPCKENHRREIFKSKKEALEEDIYEICREHNLKEKNIQAINIEMKKKMSLSVDEIAVQADAMDYNFKSIEAHDCDICEDNFLDVSDLEMHKKKNHESTAKQLLQI